MGPPNLRRLAVRRARAAVRRPGETGVSTAAREIYYEKLRAFARQYDFPLVNFAEHNSDPAFLDPQGYQLSAKGWISYNRALDEFFHDAQPSALFGWRQKSD